MSSRPTEGLREVLVFCSVVFVWTWGIAALMILRPVWVANVFGELDGSFHPLFFLAVYAPSATALLLTSMYEGTEGIRRLLVRLHPKRAQTRWYVLVVLGMVSLSLFSGLGAAVLGSDTIPTIASGSTLLSALGVAILAVPGPLGEELGWRGFMLPRLLGTWSPLASGFILGCIWAAWHLPAFFLSGSPQQEFALPLFLLGAVALSMMVTWLFIRANGSVLISILFHLMANEANDLTGVSFEAFAVGTIICALLLVASGQLRDSPARPDAMTK